jgi:hypothetical protein
MLAWKWRRWVVENVRATIIREKQSKIAQQYTLPSRAWILSVVATRVIYACSSKAVNRSAGVSQPRVFRGRVLSCSATAWRSVTL